MTLEAINTPHAPQAIGPYSQAMRAGNLLFVSGQIPIDPKSGELRLFDGNVAQQAELVLANLGAILASQNAGPQQVIKTTIFLRSMDDFSAVNEVYGKFFGDHRPARATIAVAGLPKNVSVEIEAVALL